MASLARQQSQQPMAKAERDPAFQPGPAAVRSASLPVTSTMAGSADHPLPPKEQQEVEEEVGLRLPPGHLTLLPPLFLVQAAARLPTLAGAHYLAIASRELHMELTPLRSVFAAARAMLVSRKPGRHLPNRTRTLLQRVPCTPQAIVWLHGFVGGDAGRVMQRPDVVDWVVKAAAAWRDLRTLDWLLGINDAERAFLMRYYHRVAWDDAWLAATGHAAGAGHVSLTKQLLRLPSAPGQSGGLKRLGAAQKTTLLTTAIHTHLGRSPHAQHAEREAAMPQDKRIVAALEALLPLSYLPYRSTPVPMFPFGQPSEEQQRAEEGRLEALAAAARLAMEHGVRGAVTVLGRHGLDLSTGSKVMDLMKRTIRLDMADVLRELIMLPVGSSGRSVWQEHAAQVQAMGKMAAQCDKPLTLRVTLDVLPDTITRYDLASLLTSGHVETAIVLLTHPRSTFRAPVTDSSLLEAAMRVPAVEEGAKRKRVWEVLLAAGQPVDEQLLKLAQAWKNEEAAELIKQRLELAGA